MPNVVRNPVVLFIARMTALVIVSVAVSLWRPDRHSFQGRSFFLQALAPHSTNFVDDFEEAAQLSTFGEVGALNRPETRALGVSVIVPITKYMEEPVVATFFENFFAHLRYPTVEVIVVLEEGIEFTAERYNPPVPIATISMAAYSTFYWEDACAVGALRSQFPLLLFLSPRAIPRNDVVSHLAHPFHTSDSIGIAGARMVSAYGRTTSHPPHPQSSSGLVDGTNHTHKDNKNTSSDPAEGLGKSSTLMIVIQNHGYALAMPTVDDIVIVQRLAGYSSKDARARAKASEVLFVNHLCLMMRKSLLSQLEGFALDLQWPNHYGRSQAKEGELEGSAWDFSLRARQIGFSTVVTPASISLNSDAYSHPNEVPDEIVLSSVGEAFAKKWRSYLLDLYNQSSIETLKNESWHVLWDSFCVKCFGFTNELVHFVVPMELEGHYHLRLVPSASNCFCDGFPTSVVQSLRRLSRVKGFEFNAGYSTTPLGGLYLSAYANYDSPEPNYNKAPPLTLWVSHKDPGSYPRFPNTILSDRPDYVVGRSMFEYSRFPAEWLTNCNDNTLVDEIWVPSKHVFNLFVESGVRKEKVFVLPEATDVYLYDPAATQPFSLPGDLERLGWASASTSIAATRHLYWRRSLHQHELLRSNFKFFSMFKWENRKGWDVLLQAFAREFDESEPVSLYIATYIYGEPDSRDAKKLLSRVENYLNGFKPDAAHIHIITEQIAESDLVRLYRSMDCFVLPSRGEGWGLPLVQAMAMGLPTIATNWSGNLDFMTPNTSYLIEATLEPVPGETDDRMWAQPSIPHLRTLMRDVYSNREKAREVGKAARQHIVQHFSESAVLKIMQARLDAIKAQLLAKGRPTQSRPRPRPGPPPSSVPAFSPSYFLPEPTPISRLHGLDRRSIISLSTHLYSENDNLCNASYYRTHDVRHLMCNLSIEPPIHRTSIPSDSWRHDEKRSEVMEIQNRFGPGVLSKSPLAWRSSPLMAPSRTPSQPAPTSEGDGKQEGRAPPSFIGLIGRTRSPGRGSPSEQTTDNSEKAPPEVPVVESETAASESRTKPSRKGSKLLLAL